MPTLPPLRRHVLKFAAFHRLDQFSKRVFRRYTGIKTGVIFVNGIIDRESQAQYEFRVLASDGDLNSTTMVSIEVLDMNDNTPTFSEQTPVGFEVVETNATDAGARLGGSTLAQDAPLPRREPYVRAAVETHRPV